MPLPVRPNSSAQPLFESKSSRDGPSSSSSADSSPAAKPMKKVNNNEIEIQTAETSETFDTRQRLVKSLPGVQRVREEGERKRRMEKKL